MGVAARQNFEGEIVIMPLSPTLVGHVIRALAAVLPFSEPADGVLSRYFRQNHQLGIHERALIAETVYAILRRKRWLDALAPDVSPRRLVLVALTMLRGISLRELAPLLDPDENDWLKTLKARPVETTSLAVQAEFPDWLVDKLHIFLCDEDILALGRAMQVAAPLDLRVNTLRTSRDDVLNTFNQEGIAATPTPHSPLGVRLVHKIALNRHPLFLSGMVEVQDEGSQLVGLLVAPRRRDMVVDFCAGAGGKTLLLGALMHSQGRVYALDVSEKRLSQLKPRLKRAGLSNLHPQRISHENDAKIQRLRGKIDRVLVDAPCSGLGTLRRNPDLKWRQSPTSVTELSHKQAAILASAATLLKAGGRLVYATCSVLPEENTQIVEHFLQTHPDFRLVSCAEVLRAGRIDLDTGPYLQLTPNLHGCDAFFAAVLEKTTAAEK